VDKRSFIKKSVLLGMGLPLFLESLAKNFEQVKGTDAFDLASEDEFWAKIRNDYILKQDYINLENGYYCMLPHPLLNQYIEHVKEVNLHASYYMRKKQGQDKKRIAKNLSELAHCSEEELIITRNATESLDLVINGFKWQKGDEAIMAEQDYGSMLDMFKLMEGKYGIVSKRVSIPNDPSNDEEIVRLYESQITSKTRLIMICHMVNISGHILPVRKICDMAHAHNVEVMVDGAHSFAHIPCSMKELDCDYFGTSLHKWLNAPLGNGMLYIKKEKIAKLWPLFAESPKSEDDIMRLNHTGTTPVHTILGIQDAIDYHEVIGLDRKNQRLRFLQRYWTDKIRSHPKIVLNTPEDPMRSCAIANVGIKGIPPKELANILLDKYGIWTVAINRPSVEGCRITPNIYTSIKELDSLVSALKAIAEG